MPILCVRVPIPAKSSHDELMQRIRDYLVREHGSLFVDFDWTNKFVHSTLANVDKEAFMEAFPGCDAAYFEPTW